MDNAALLTRLKVDLGILRTDAYDDRMTQLLIAAQKEIKEAGVTLIDSDPEDEELVVAWAAWKWTQRRTGAGMPRMVRLMLNSRLMREVRNRA